MYTTYDIKLKNVILWYIQISWALKKTEITFVFYVEKLTFVLLHQIGALILLLKIPHKPHQNLIVNYISKDNYYIEYQGGACPSSNCYQTVMWYPWEGHSRA